MGKTTGFLEFERELPTERPPLERIKDWDEFHHHMPVAKLQEQGARCMDCGIPFCHTGELISGMASGCPINNLIPEWNDLVYRGLWREALDRLHATNNFPEFTGRVCPAPCEGSCTLGIIDPPVTIKNIEMSIVDKGFAEGWIVASPPATRTGKKVAVVGSGPAGLSCAAQLNSVGHSVTIFERADRIGGLLMYGIPNMKLDKEKVVQRRIDLMAAEGITFVTNCEIGKDLSATDLLQDFEAVVLCCGATKPNDFFAKTEGRDLEGIHFAMDFLRGNTKYLLDSHLGIYPNGNGPHLSAKDKDVIVIGGGDTGTDCVGTSIRHGCRSLAQFEILPQSPLERAADNPWPEWPKIHRIDYGQAEAIALYGEEPRTYAISTKKFVGDENGHIKELHTVRLEWKTPEDGGRPYPEEVPGSEEVWPAQLVLLALGFRGPEDTVIEQFGLERDQRSNVQAEYGPLHHQCRGGVFAAGDMRRGQSLVGRGLSTKGRAAVARAVVIAILMGETDLP